MHDIESITVIGAGTMGRGIAQTAAMSGYRVALVDAAPDVLAKSLASIEEITASLVERGKMRASERNAALALLSTAASIGEGAARADLVVEAVPESLELKQRIFREIDAAAPPHAVLASNTSSLSIGTIAGAVADPGRVVGMHFFNPVPVMPLLEVVRAAGTSKDAVATALSVGKRLGKETILVRDAPGFATSRLGVLLGLEAIRMLEQQVASAEDIDRAMTLGYKHPMGPLRLTDLVGLDVRLAIAEHLHRELRSEAFAVPALLRKLVAEGKLGKKTGQGFYRWDV